MAPFAETKELVGGYAIFDLKSKEEAIQMGTDFMQLHGDVMGPSYEGELEIRPIFGPPPNGAKQLNSYLHFNGQCEAAFKFYEECLGGKIVSILTHGDSPIASQVPSERRNQVLHASLTIGNETLMGCDTPPEHYQKPQGFSVALHVKDPKEAERKFHALAENGTVQMPLQETFWSVRFGMVVDRFGIPWMVNCEQAA